MAYDAQTKIIYQEVGIGDLQQCFAVILHKKTDASVNVLSGDLGSIFKGGTGEEFTDPSGVVWKVLSRVAVNKWAKHKPIKHAAFTELTPAQWVDGSVRAGEVYGIYQNSTPNDFPFDANGDYMQRPWLYDRPLFSDTQYPSRYTDFLNYYHYAPCPIQIVFQASNNIEISTSEQDRKNTYLSCVLTFENGISGYRTDNTCMSLADILGGTYRNYYFAIVLWRKVNNNILRYFAFAENTIQQYIDAHNNNGAPPVIPILMNIDDFYTAVGANNFTAGDVWNCRAFLAPSQQQSISTGHLIQYADNPTDCDFKQFTVTRPGSSYKVGKITLTATLTRNGASGDEYFLSSYTITVERGTWTGVMNIDYEIFGLCPTGRMMQGGTAVSGELVLDSGTLSIPVGSSSNSKTVNFPTASAGTFNFAQTGSGNPHIAVAGFRFTYSQESKNVAVEFDCTSNGSSYTGTRQN